MSGVVDTPAPVAAAPASALDQATSAAPVSRVQSNAGDSTAVAEPVAAVAPTRSNAEASGTSTQGSSRLETSRVATLGRS